MNNNEKPLLNNDMFKIDKPDFELDDFLNSIFIYILSIKEGFGLYLYNSLEKEEK